MSKQYAVGARLAGPLAVINKKLPRYFTPDEVRRIIDGVENLRDKLLLEVLWQTGGRVSEVLQLTPGAIDFNNDCVRLVTLKRRALMERAIPAKPQFLGMLAKFVAANRLQENDRLFPITRFRAHQIVRQACAAAGIGDERAHAHTFRHSFGAHLIRSMPITALKSLMGHANVDSTLVYSALSAQDVRRHFETVQF